MNPEEWRRVRELFEEIADAPAAERAERLAGIGDERIRHEVQGLLDALGEEDRIERDRSALGRHLGEDAEGERVGPYRLIRRVGRGGMGDVYMAERVDGQFDRRVAIKVIRPGMGSDAVVERFRKERQILAALSHPAIAPLLDGGVTRDGLPYLVMEYLEGEPITVSSERRGLSVDERIRLFRNVCSAVHFAHQNLVIHRDLKPSNILVLPDRSVRLLDFGVAKLLLPDGTATMTELGGVGFTPAYASPEQIRGDPVTTASDVYSLGVVLYELLTGRRPYDIDATSYGSMLRSMETLEPTRPSRALQESPKPAGAALRRKLSGDLDNIVLMAIEKDPARRYASVHDLSEDLRRYLEGRPIIARADTFGYRIGKFVRRNRTGVIAATGITALVIAGLWGTLSQSQRASVEHARAEQRVQDLWQLTNALLFDVHDAVADLPGATDARRLILDRGFANLEQLTAEIGDDSLRHRIAEAYLRLGMVQGQPTGASLGDLTAAQRSYERAIDIADALVASNPRNHAMRRTLALAHEKNGDVLAWSGNIDEGVRHASAALDLYRTIATAYADSARHRMSLAISTVKLGDLTGHPVFPNLGRPEESLSYYEAAREILHAPPLADTPDWNVRRYRALVDERIGMMHRIAERWAEARKAFAASLEERVRLAGERPDNTDARRDVAIAHQQLCEIELADGRTQAALILCERAAEGYESLFAADSHNAQARTDVALGAMSWAGALEAVGRTTEARRAAERAVEVLEASVSEHPDNTSEQEQLERARELLARLRRG